MFIHFFCPGWQYCWCPVLFHLIFNLDVMQHLRRWFVILLFYPLLIAEWLCFKADRGVAILRCFLLIICVGVRSCFPEQEMFCFDSKYEACLLWAVRWQCCWGWCVSCFYAIFSRLVLVFFLWAFPLWPGIFILHEWSNVVFKLGIDCFPYASHCPVCCSLWVSWSWRYCPKVKGKWWWHCSVVSVLFQFCLQLLCSPLMWQVYW